MRTEEGSPCSHALSSALQTCAAAAVMPVVLLDAARGLQTWLLVALRCSFLVPDSFDFSLYSWGESKVPKVQIWRPQKPPDLCCRCPAGSTGLFLELLPEEMISQAWDSPGDLSREICRKSLPAVPRCLSPCLPGDSSCLGCLSLSHSLVPCSSRGYQK